MDSITGTVFSNLTRNHPCRVERIEDPEIARTSHSTARGSIPFVAEWIERHWTGGAILSGEVLPIAASPDLH